MNLYQKWEQEVLPEKMQRKIDGSIAMIEDYEERIFKAGFMCAICLEKEEFKKELGLDEKKNKNYR